MIFKIYVTDKDIPLFAFKCAWNNDKDRIVLLEIKIIHNTCLKKNTRFKAKIWNDEI